MDVGMYAAEEVLRDGARVWIRAIRPDDKERLAQFHARLSPESVYFRFFEFKRTLSPQDLRHFTELDFTRRVGLVATLGSDAGAAIVGVARYDVLPRRTLGLPDGELGIVVEDAHQGRGIGTLLLRHLLGLAYAHGVRHIVADVLPQNSRMLELVAGSGVPVRQRLDGSVIHLEL
jgi:GNAT superfamily N-acetyltransferase